ncbi:MAG: type IV pilus assembly protein PilM [Candidatus Paceibacterota bacterium]
MSIFNDKINPFGLDFSDRAVKVAQLGEKDGKYFLRGCQREEIPQGIIEEGDIKNPAELVKYIKLAMAKAAPQAIRSKFVIYSIPETKGFIRVIKIPYEKKDDLESAIFAEVEQLFPVSLEESYLDWQVLGGKKESEEYLEVLVAVVPQVVVDSYSEVLSMAGFRPVAAEIESIAISRSLVNEKVSQKPMLIIDLGKDRTGFIIYKSPAVQFTASIPVCGKEFNKAIARQLDISEEEAEVLKYKCGLSTRGECQKVYRAMDSNLNEMMGYIDRLLGYYHEHFTEESDIAKVIICGGEARLNGISSLLSLKIKKEIEKGSPWVNIISSVQEIPAISRNDSMVFVTVLGLALRGVEKDDTI